MGLASHSDAVKGFGIKSQFGSFNGDKGDPYTVITFDIDAMSKGEAKRLNLIFMTNPRIREAIDIAQSKNRTPFPYVGDMSVRIDHRRRTLEWTDYFPFRYWTHPTKGIAQEIERKVLGFIRHKFPEISYVRHSNDVQLPRRIQLKGRGFERNSWTGFRYTFRRGRKLLLRRIRHDRKRFATR